MRLAGRLLAAVLVAAAVAASVTACGEATASIGPLGPCGDDARGAGAYPELERLLPTGLEGRPPDKLDSGRSCSAKALGTLASHGISELHYAGATWNEGGSNGTVIATFAISGDGPVLREQWIEEFYETSARDSNKTENIETSRPVIGDAGEVWRLDTLNDLSLQTVVVWEHRGRVRVVIVATNVNPNASRADHDRRVERAVVTAAATAAPDASRSDGEPVLVSRR